MRKRKIPALFLAIAMIFCYMPAMAFADGDPMPDPIATFTTDLPDTADSLYMGSIDGWPLSATLTFTNADDVGTLSYQWYRAVGDGEAEAYGEPFTFTGGISEGQTAFSTAPFERSVLQAGAFTHYVVFTNVKDGVPQTFTSTARTTYVAPQVLWAYDHNYTDTKTYYYFQGASANELTVNLGIPTVAPGAQFPEEYAEDNYGTIKYQWYKSLDATSELVYDDFPFFDEERTPAVSGANGNITYEQAAAQGGIDISHTPVNDKVGNFHYFLFVWDEWNGCISYTPNSIDAIIEVMDSPATSVQRPGTAKAIVALEKPQLPDPAAGADDPPPAAPVVNSEFKYVLLPEGTALGDSPEYLTGTFDGDGKVTLTFEQLVQGKYILYLLFTDSDDGTWPCDIKIPAYKTGGGGGGGGTVKPDPSGDVKTNGDAVTVKTDVKTTDKGTSVTVTDQLFREAAKRVAQNGSNLQIDAGKATVSFDAAAVKEISAAAGSGDVVLEINEADKSTLSDENKAIVGDRPVYDFNMMIGNKKVSSFGDGEVTLSIPYTLAAGEAAEAIVVYYIDDAGRLNQVQGAYDAASHSVVFSTNHFSYYAIGYNPVQFKDVKESDWHYKAITFIAARDISEGVSEDLFAPNANITRGQFVVMLMRAYGIEPEANPTNNFADAGDTYYTGYLAAAKKLGITDGTGENLFAPDNNISRQDMFTMLYRALDVLDAVPEKTKSADLSHYTDGASVKTYAQDAFKALLSADIISGNGDCLLPDHTATRAEMAKVLYELLS